MCAVETAFFVPLGSASRGACGTGCVPVWTGCGGSASRPGAAAGRSAACRSGGGLATADTPWAQSLPWVGMVGVSFLVALSGTTLAWLLLTRRAASRRALVAVGALVVVTLAPAVAHLPLDETGTATVAAVQGDVPGTGLNVPAARARSPRTTCASPASSPTRWWRAGEEPRPTSCCGRRTPRRSTRSSTRRCTPASSPRRTRSACDRGRRPHKQPARRHAGAQPGHRLPARRRRGRPLHQAAPGAVRGSTSVPGQPADALELRAAHRGAAATWSAAPPSSRSASVTCSSRTRSASDVAYDEGIAARSERGRPSSRCRPATRCSAAPASSPSSSRSAGLRALETGRWGWSWPPSTASRGVVRPDGTVVASVPARGQEVLVERVGLEHDDHPGRAAGDVASRFVMTFLVAHTAWVLIPIVVADAGRPPRPPAPKPLSEVTRVSVDGLGRCVMSSRPTTSRRTWSGSSGGCARPAWRRRPRSSTDNSPDGTGAIAVRLAAADEAVSVVHRTEKEGLGRGILTASTSRSRRATT